ncbi:MAG: hypothetical protein ACFBSF_08320 [Leptolyngbyaceae cyanobacterium]
MPTNLTTVLRDLLTESLPAPLGGDDPLLQLAIALEQLQFVNDPTAGDTTGAPRPDNRTDSLAFDTDNPEGPYTLTQFPYPGARQVRLVTPDGDRIPLSNQEVIWGETDAHQFSLALTATRDPATVTQVEVLYGVAAIFTTLYATQQVTLTLSRSQPSEVEPDLDQVAALAIAVLQLNRQLIVDTARSTYEIARYRMTSQINRIRLVNLNSPTPDERQIVVDADITLKATQVSGEQSGVPIQTVQVRMTP